MKKYFIISLLSIGLVSSYASVGNTSHIGERPECTRTCSYTYVIGDTTISIEFRGGWLLSSCRRAERRCKEKMAEFDSSVRQADVDASNQIKNFEQLNK